MKKYQKHIISIIITCCATLFCLLLNLSFPNMENINYDLLFKHIKKYEKVTNPIIICIDQNSLDYFQKDLQILWPWPRDIYGIITEYLDYCDVEVTAYDILFTSPDIERLNSDAFYADSAFTSAIDISDNIVLAAQLEDSTLSRMNPLIKSKAYSNITIPDKICANFPKASLPISQFQKSAASLGAVNFSTDEDGIIRKVPLFFKIQDELIPHLGLASYVIGKKIKSVNYDQLKNTLNLDNLSIPLTKSGKYIINWYGKGGVNNSFQYYSFANLFKSAMQWKMKEIPFIKPENLKSKAIFIGATAAGLLDLKPTPVSSIHPYPGVEIYATIYKNLLSQDFITDFSKFSWILIVFIFLFIQSKIWQSDKVVKPLIYSVILFTIPVILSIFLFKYHDKFLPIVSFEISMILTLIGSVASEYFLAGKKSRLIKKTFNRYLDPKLVKKMIDSTEDMNTAGKEINATVLFSDLQGFTSFSEKLSPQKTVEMLNNYFEKGEKIIFKNNGMLDKYTGDGMMALFGITSNNSDHAIEASQAALDFANLTFLTDQNGNDETKNLETRIGVNTGPLVAGNIGSSRRVDYTAIGNTVNISARLEALNKVFGTTNLISFSTCELANSIFVCRNLDYYNIRGTTEPLQIFTILCKKDKMNKETEKLLKLHNDAIASYHEKNLLDAKEKFNNLLKEFPNDSVAKYFITQC